jgi:hypothetical protein
MIHIDKLIEANKNNHYQLLTLVGNEEGKKKEITDYLTKRGWQVFDVEEIVLDLIKDLPRKKRGLRLGERLDDWVKKQENKLVLTNANILFSPELKQINPVESFRYALRGTNEAVLFLDARYRGDNKAVYSTPDKEDFAEIDLSRVIHRRLIEVTTGGNE